MEIEGAQIPENDTSNWEKEKESFLNEKKAMSDKNFELVGEKKSIQAKLIGLEEQLAQIGGIEGIKKLQELKSSAENENQKKFLEEGNVKEYMESVTKKLEHKYETELQNRIRENEVLSEKYNGLRTVSRQSKIENQVNALCKKLNLQDTAGFDIALRVMNDCVFDDDDNITFKDAQGNSMQTSDYNDMNIEDYINDKRKTFKHWEKPSSYGAGTGSSFSSYSAGSVTPGSDPVNQLKNILKR